MDSQQAADCVICDIVTNSRSSQSRFGAPMSHAGVTLPLDRLC